jgi:hypothetical protein
MNTKKLWLKLAALEAAFLLVLAPLVASAQSYPAPTFGSLALQNPLTPANGGTGATTSTGTGSVVLSNSPALTTPNLGTPSAVTLTNATGLPVSGLATLAANTVLANVTASTASPTAFAMPSCSGANNALRWTSGTGFSCASAIALTSGTLAQFAATTSAQLAGVVSDETGSGSLVFGTSPTIATPSITGASTFSVRPTFNGATPWDSANLTASNGAGLFTYQQGATGTIARTLTNKLQDSVSIKDFSASPTTTDFQNAINATSSGGTITIPFGSYTPTLSSLSFGTKSIRFDAQSGAGLGTTDPITSGGSTMLDQTMQALGNGYAYKSSLIYDTLNATAGGTGYSVGSNTVQWFGGSNAQGGRAAVQGIVALTSATSATNPNRNYQGGAFQGIANAADNGTSGSPQGQVFGGGSQGILNAGATNYLNVSAWEFNTTVATGASVTYKSGIQVSANPTDAIQGSTYDGAVSISNQTGAVGWRNGILFSNANGQQPMWTGGNLIATQGSATVLNGINLNSYTFTGAAILTPGFSVSPSGSISSTGAGNFISLGATGSTNTPAMTFYTGAGAASYDGRFLWSGGSGANGTASLEIDSASVLVGGTLSANGNDALSYLNTSAQSIPNNAFTTVTGWTKDFDRISANFNASTGIFTAPASCSSACIYDVDATVTFGGSTSSVGTDYAVQIVANGVVKTIGDYRSEAASTLFRQVQAHTKVSVTAGQTIAIQAFQNTGGAVALTNATGYNHVAISRVP